MKYIFVLHIGQSVKIVVADRTGWFRDSKPPAQCSTVAQKWWIASANPPYIHTSYELANKATLVTHNTKEFSRINQLRLEDWFD